jgi:hypothetical protein
LRKAGSYAVARRTLATSTGARPRAGQWNRPLLERQTIGDIDSSKLHALQTNDMDLVRRTAFDVEDLRRRTERAEEFVEIEVVRRILSMGQEPLAWLEISSAVPLPTCLRVDRLLAGELGVSRARVREWPAKRRLTLFPHGARMLRRPVRDGMCVSIDMSADGDDVDMRTVLDGFDSGSPP